MNYDLSASIGDVLACGKVFGFIRHRGVYLGGNTVLTNTPEKGEHVTTVSGFSDGQAIEVRPTHANEFVVLDRARRILAKCRRFDLIRRNCEHTTYETVEGKAKSPQLIFWAVIAALVLFVWFLFRKR